MKKQSSQKEEDVEKFFTKLELAWFAEGDEPPQKNFDEEAWFAEGDQPFF